MKNTSHLISDLYSFIPFVQSLKEKESEFYLSLLYEKTTVISALSSIYLQDKLYAHYYFPSITKGIELKAHDKKEERKLLNEILLNIPFYEVVESLCNMRQQLISLLQHIPQERMHAFFKIENVSFTMYDHIEKIIWNDAVISEYINQLPTYKTE